MPVITARKDGCINANAICSPSKSMVVIDVRLSGIDKSDITGATYQFGDSPYRAVKTLGNGIDIGDDGLLITLTADDTSGKGKYEHYLELTDSSGTYKANLNFGRMELQ